MPYTIQARKLQFDDWTVHEPDTVATFQDALLYIKEKMLAVQERIGEPISFPYRTFRYSRYVERTVHDKRYAPIGFNPPVETVTLLPEEDSLGISFGHPDPEYELWSFRIMKDLVTLE
jgi:hypothetical protein